MVKLMMIDERWLYAAISKAYDKFNKVGNVLKIVKVDEVVKIIKLLKFFSNKDCENCCC